MRQIFFDGVEYNHTEDRAENMKAGPQTNGIVSSLFCVKTRITAEEL